MDGESHLPGPRKKLFCNYSKRHVQRLIKEGANVEAIKYKKIKLNETFSKPVTLNDEPLNPTVLEDFSSYTNKSDFPKLLEMNEVPSNIIKNNFINNFRLWIINHNISHNSVNALLNILTTDLNLSYLPKDCRSLLKIKNKTKAIVKKGNGHFYYFGLERQILFNLHKFEYKGPEILNLKINIDGLPLCKSSQSQFWPILASIENISKSKPFCVGLWQGNCKPSDQNDFLKPFVDDVINIEKNGINFLTRNYVLKITKIICDAPAKSFILNVLGHNGYNGCTKCTVVGDYSNHRMSYNNLTAELRNDADFLNVDGSTYHKGTTVLTQLNLGLVNNVPLDYMHLVCLGVMKRLLTLWLKKGSGNIKMVKDNVTSLNNNLIRFRKNCVSEFSRLPRSTADLANWKATEFREFLLYYGPIALKGNLTEPYYSHFLTFHISLRILVSADFSQNKKLLDFAEKLLIYFVQKFRELYGDSYVTHNVHNLIHLCNDVRKHGSLDQFSSFPFENALYTIKKQLKTSRYPLEQYINRVEEYLTYDTEPVENIRENEINLRKHIDFEKINGNFVDTYEGLEYKNLYFNVKLPNCYCVFKEGTVGQILKLYKDHGEVYAMYKKFSNLIPVYYNPCSSDKIYYGKFALVHFVDSESSNYYSVVPCSWLKQVDNKLKCYWPVKNINRNAIMKKTPPNPMWKLHNITVMEKFANYENAIEAEKELCATTESENERGLGKRKVKKITFSPPKLDDETLIATTSCKYDVIDDTSVDDSTIPTPSESEEGTSFTSPIPEDHQDINIPIEIIEVEEHEQGIELEHIKNILLDLKSSINIIMIRLNSIEMFSQSRHQELLNEEKIKHIPIDTIDNLLKLEDLVTQDETARQQLFRKCCSTSGSTNKNMVRRCMALIFTDKLGTFCSWTGQKNNLKVKDMTLLQTIKNAVRSSFGGSTDREFEICVMEWLRHSKQRLNRKDS